VDNEALREQCNSPRLSKGEGIKPEEKQALIKIINDILNTNIELQTSNKKLQTSSDAQSILIKDLSVRLENAEKNIENLFPLVAKMNKKQPGKTDTERMQKLIRYMNLRPDHKSSFDSLKGFLQIKDNQLNATIKAINKMYPARYLIKKDEHDKRKRWLIARI
jgi:hypothetical protein